MATAFEIEKGVPLPKGRGCRSTYPFKTMEVGDSFFVPESEAQAARSSSYAFASYNKVKFTVRAVEGGVRVWRIS